MASCCPLFYICEIPNIDSIVALVLSAAYDKWAVKFFMGELQQWLIAVDVFIPN